jgi:hypothetical protein
VWAAAVRASAAHTAHGVHVIPAPRLGPPGFRVKSCCVAWVPRACFRHQPPWLGSTLLEIRRCLDVEVENCPSNGAKVLDRYVEPDVLLLAVVAFEGQETLGSVVGVEQIDVGTVVDHPDVSRSGSGYARRARALSD